MGCWRELEGGTKGAWQPPPACTSGPLRAAPVAQGHLMPLHQSRPLQYL